MTWTARMSALETERGRSEGNGPQLAYKGSGTPGQTGTQQDHGTKEQWEVGEGRPGFSSGLRAEGKNAGFSLSREQRIEGRTGESEGEEKKMTFTEIFHISTVTLNGFPQAKLIGVVFVLKLNKGLRILNTQQWTIVS